MSKRQRLRLERIERTLFWQRTSTIDELAESLKVSTITIRRDLKLLGQEGRIVQAHGGGVIYRPEFSDRSRTKPSAIGNIDQKIRIGEYCIGIVEQRDEIIVGPGTTALIAGRILSGISDLEFRLITNSLELARDLSGIRNIHTFVLGGELKDSHTLWASSRESFFASCHKRHKLLFSADGVDITGGITSFHSDLVAVCQNMIDASCQVYLLADASKLGKVAFNFVAPIERVTTLVTDTGAPGAFSAQLEARGIEVVRV